jgi:hypothetical protein
MNKFKHLLGLAAVAAIVTLATLDARAQAGNGGGNGNGRRGNRGNFDPAQRRQMRLDQAREQLEVTSDDDWKVIGDRVVAVIDAETEAAALRSRGGGPGGRGGRNRGGNNGNADTANNGNAQQPQQNTGGNRNGRFGAPSPELEALQKAIESNAPADEVKAALAKLHDVRKAKQSKLEAAQEELRKVLSVRQEGQAVLAGLLS